MGFNTAVVMHNDLTHAWPKEILDAFHLLHARDRPPEFRGGVVISTAHASDTQIIAVGGNTGRRISPIGPARPEDLETLSELLRAHGYSVKAPGQAKAQGPLRWGYYAEKKREDQIARKAAKDAQSG